MVVKKRRKHLTGTVDLENPSVPPYVPPREVFLACRMNKRPGMRLLEKAKCLHSITDENGHTSHRVDTNVLLERLPAMWGRLLELYSSSEHAE